MNRNTKICSLVVFVLALVTAMVGSQPVVAGVSGTDHQQGFSPDLSVIDVMDMHGPVLLKDEVGGVDIVIGWEQGNLFVYENGVLAKIETGFDVLGRPAFRTPHMDGSFSYDRDNSLVVNITVAGQSPERLSSIGGITTRRANCNCFGTGSGGTTKTCTDSMCDTADDCQDGGTGDRNCRWSAGSRSSVDRGQIVIIE